MYILQKLKSNDNKIYGYKKELIMILTIYFKINEVIFINNY